VKGSCCCIVKVLSQHPPGGTDKRHKLSGLLNTSRIYAETVTTPSTFYAELYLCGMHPVALLTYTIQTYNIKYIYIICLYSSTLNLVLLLTYSEIYLVQMVT
jgi:hypothetical protein